MGTSLSTSCGWDGSYVSLQCLTPHLDASLDLAVDVLRNPTFPESEWERIHGQTLAGLRAERDSAEARAYRGLLQRPLRPGPPLPAAGRRRGGDRRAGWRATTCGVPRPLPRPEPGRLRRGRRRRPRPRSPRCSTRRLAGWPGRRSRGPRSPTPAAATAPASSCSTARGRAGGGPGRATSGLPRLDPDFTDVLVLNQILGGQFTSRLNAKLREEKGFTYGVRSHFDCRRGAGPFAISASLQADRLAEALDDLRHEVEALLGDRPPTLPELDDARRALIEGQARQFETPSALVSRYAGLFIHGLPPDHHAHFAERLDGVSVASLGRRREPADPSPRPRRGRGRRRRASARTAPPARVGERRGHLRLKRLSIRARASHPVRRSDCPAKTHAKYGRSSVDPGLGAAFL